jgi:hypothetical protein
MTTSPHSSVATFACVAFSRVALTTPVDPRPSHAAQSAAALLAVQGQEPSVDLKQAISRARLTGGIRPYAPRHAGVSAAELDEVDDQDDCRSALVELIVRWG